MGLRRTATKRIPVPDEPEQWIEIQAVSFVTLRDSRQEQIAQILKNRDLFTMAREAAANGGFQEERAAAAADPFLQHDQMTLLEHGLVGWSYPGEVDPEELDEKTAEWAARQILEYTSPGEAQVKTLSSPSTGTGAAKGQRRTNG